MDGLFKYYKESLSDNLCDEYKSLWRMAMNDNGKLMKLAMCQQSLPHVITYAYQGRGMSKDYLLTEFREYINGYIVKDADGVKGYTYAMFVGDSQLSDINGDIDVYAFLWCDDVCLEISEGMCPTIYVGCNSHIDISCVGCNSIRIYLFDDSSVTINADETCNVVVLKYSDKCNVIKDEFCLCDKIKEFDKELRL